jgi:agmatine/peptidylarginine deiminase
VILAWPHAGTDWAPRLAEVERAYVGLVATVARFEPVLLCVADADGRGARARTARRPGRRRRVRYARLPYDDTWLRDSGPITLHEGERSACSISTSPPGAASSRPAGRPARFGPGSPGAFGPPSRERDRFRAGRRRHRDRRRRHPAEHLALPARAPSRSLARRVERVLRESLRQDRVLWLERGYLEGDDTDAHIDTLRPASLRATASSTRAARTDPTATTASCRRWRRSWPSCARATASPTACSSCPGRVPILDEGRRLAASYANFLIVDGAVLMPSYGDPADDEAALVLAEAFPDREIVQVDCRPLIWQNGSLHCLTMQLPAGVLNMEASA